jgi:hypothetical protein
MTLATEFEAKLGQNQIAPRDVVFLKEINRGGRSLHILGVTVRLADVVYVERNFVKYAAKNPCSVKS